MRKTFAIGRFALALAVLGYAGAARGDVVIEFTPTTASPNSSGSANTGAYGSDANVSVGYSAYTYNYSSGYGGLNGGTGAGIYSDDSPTTEVMTFTAATGYTVTLKNFNLAEYLSFSDKVDISVTGGSSSYSLTGQTPAGGAGNFTTYSPNITGTSLTLTITNLYDVGLNTIQYRESPVSSVPEPPPALMAALVGGLGLTRAAWRRRKRTV